MIRSTLKAALVAAAFAAGPGAARADFINGGFETGTFAGFDTLGTTQVTGVFAGVAPPGGSFQAVLTAGSQLPATVAAFLGTTAAQLQAANVPTPGAAINSGSAIRQTVAVAAGDVLTFNWNFLSNEFAGQTTFNDASFLVVTLPGAAPILLGNTFTPASGPAPPGFIFQTGYQTFTSAPFTSAGNVTVGVAVFNVGDNAFASALLVDNFRVAAIPEPASMTLVGLGAAGLVAYRRRKAARVA
jgi:hypothetical protein